MSDTVLVPVWNGTEGWVGQHRPKGELLGGYNSNTTLTDPARGRPQPLTPAIRVQGHYTHEQRVIVRRMAANKISANVIATYMQIPLGTVKNMIYRQRDPRLKPGAPSVGNQTRNPAALRQRSRLTRPMGCAPSHESRSA